MKYDSKSWTLFTKRTNDPKLSYIEYRLDELGVPHRRNGESFHAPILEVPEEYLKVAWKLLDERHGRYRLDDVRDDHPKFAAYEDFRSIDDNE